MIHSTWHPVTRHKVELSEGEVHAAIIEYIANRRPHMCPLDVAEDAKPVFEQAGGKGFKFSTEEQETRNGPPGEMVEVVIVEYEAKR
jgi:hypothetical protein